MRRRMADDPDAKELRARQRMWFEDSLGIGVTKVTAELHYDDAGTACIKDQNAHEHLSWKNWSGWDYFSEDADYFIQNNFGCDPIFPGQPRRSSQGRFIVNKVWFDNSSFPACSGTVWNSFWDVQILSTVFLSTGSYFGGFTNAGVACSPPFDSLDLNMDFDLDCKKHC